MPPVPLAESTARRTATATASEPGRRPHRRVRPRNSHERGLGGSPSREAKILFPRMKMSTGHEAEVVGRLVFEGAGCLRLRYR
jgi:hypothetical protein